MLHIIFFRAYQGRQWCYVENGAFSTCVEKTPSRKYRGQYWSWHACFTPARTDYECRNVRRPYYDQPARPAAAIPQNAVASNGANNNNNENGANSGGP